MPLSVSLGRDSDACSNLSCGCFYYILFVSSCGSCRIIRTVCFLLILQSQVKYWEPLFAFLSMVHEMFKCRFSPNPTHLDQHYSVHSPSVKVCAPCQWVHTQRLAMGWCVDEVCGVWGACAPLGLQVRHPQQLVGGSPHGSRKAVSRICITLVRYKPWLLCSQHLSAIQLYRSPQYSGVMWERSPLEQHSGKQLAEPGTQSVCTHFLSWEESPADGVSLLALSCSPFGEGWHCLYLLQLV